MQSNEELCFIVAQFRTRKTFHPANQRSGQQHVCMCVALHSTAKSLARFPCHTFECFPLLLLLYWLFTTHLRVLASSVLRFRDHTQWHNTVSRTPLDEWSARRRDLYLTNTRHSQQTNIYAPGGILTRNPSNWAAADPRLRPLDHWDRQCFPLSNWIMPVLSHDLARDILVVVRVNMHFVKCGLDKMALEETSQCFTSRVIFSKIVCTHLWYTFRSLFPVINIPTWWPYWLPRRKQNYGCSVQSLELL
jgi:hypothetical protein